MRRLPFLAGLVFALAFATSALAAPLFLVEGRGWGHGIGMPQYGAYGYALKEGRTYDWILAHYYRGTTLGAAPATVVRVLLADRRSAITIASAAPFSATDARGRTFHFPAGPLRLGPALRVRVNGRVRVLASPVRFSAGTRLLQLGSRPYRGALVVHAGGGRLSAVNHVGLEKYLYGVVPDEMPPSWPLEALKAQAVAARSYALVVRRSGGTFDLFPDTRSQVYGGAAAEDARTSAAIDATARRVVVYGGRVASTFFHSTSGGRTAAIQDVWPGARPAPYLVPADDPYDTLSPYHHWGPLRYTGAQLAARLGSYAPRGRLLDVTVTRNGSGRAASVLATGSRSASRIPAGSVQARLGLRSTWFTVGVLSLTAPPRVAFGSRARLAGIVRGVRVASLERKPWGRAWERLGALTLGADGSFRTATRPGSTTWYRIASPKGRGLAVRVSVAAWIRFTEFRGGNTLAGSVRPKVAGATVAIQRAQRGRWETVATARTTVTGRFRARLRVSPGAYRAVVSIRPGLVRGITPVLHVVGG